MWKTKNLWKFTFPHHVSKILSTFIWLEEMNRHFASLSLARRGFHLIARVVGEDKWGQDGSCCPSSVPGETVNFIISPQFNVRSYFTWKRFVILLGKEPSFYHFDLCSGTAGVLFSPFSVPLNFWFICIKEARQDFTTERNSLNMLAV